MAASRPIDIDALNEQVTLSAKLERILNLQNAVNGQVLTLDVSIVEDLGALYRLYLVQHWQVVINVPKYV